MFKIENGRKWYGWTDVVTMDKLDIYTTTMEELDLHLKMNYDSEFIADMNVTIYAKKEIEK